MLRKIVLGTVLAGTALVAGTGTASAATHVSSTATAAALADALHCTHVKVQKQDKDDPAPPSREITCTAPFGPLDIATWPSHAKLTKELSITTAILKAYFPGTRFYGVMGKTWIITDNSSNNMSTAAKVKKESAYSKTIATKVHARIGGTIRAFGG